MAQGRTGIFDESDAGRARSEAARCAAIEFESATDLLERAGNPVARAGARRWRKFHAERARVLGLLEGPFEEILAPATKVEMDRAMEEWAAFCRAAAQGHGAPAAGLESALGPLARRLLAQWRRTIALTAQAARAIGLQVDDASLHGGSGGSRLPGRAPECFPRMRRDEVWPLIADPGREEFYEDRFVRMVPRSTRAFAERYAAGKLFGQMIARPPGGAEGSGDYFDRLGKYATNDATARWIAALRAQVDGAAKSTRGDRFASNLRALAAGSRPFSPAELRGAARSLRALKNIVQDAMTRNTAVALGVLKSALAEAAHHVDAELEVPGVLQKLPGFRTKGRGDGWAGPIVRRHGAAAAMCYLHDFLDEPPHGKRVREGEAFLEGLGLDVANIRAEGGDFARGGETRRFLRQAVREAHLGYAFDHVAQWAQTPNGRFFAQYGRWALPRSGTLWKHVFAPALYGLWKSVGGRRYRVRTLAPLGRWLAAWSRRTVTVGADAVLTGEMFASMAAIFLDREQEDASLEAIARTGDEGRFQPLETLAGQAIHELLLGGMLGILGQPAGYVRSWFQGAARPGPLEPPVMALPRSLGELLRRLHERGLPRLAVDDLAGARSQESKEAGSGAEATRNLAARTRVSLRALQAQEAERQARSFRKSGRRLV